MESVISWTHDDVGPSRTSRTSRKIFSEIPARDGSGDATSFGTTTADANLDKAARLLATVRKRVDTLSDEKKLRISTWNASVSRATAGQLHFKSFLIQCSTQLDLAVHEARRGRKAGENGKEDGVTGVARALQLALTHQFLLYC